MDNFRGVHIDDVTQAEINDIANKGKWKGIETREKGHQMKYDWNSKLPTAWDSVNLKKMLENIKNHIYNRVLDPNPNYIIGRKNILANKKEIFVDQKPHCDYKPRK